MVIFHSDNGCSPQADPQTLAEYGHSPSGPFCGHKADLFEGGTAFLLSSTFSEGLVPRRLEMIVLPWFRRSEHAASGEPWFRNLGEAATFNLAEDVAESTAKTSRYRRRLGETAAAVS